MRILKNLCVSLILTSFIVSCGMNKNESPGIASEKGRYDDIPSRDQYNKVIENPFVEVSKQPTSTFSIDADGASYANIRRFIFQDNQMPPAGAVRTEELINYFQLHYNHADKSLNPIQLNGEISSCPWNDKSKLVRIGIKGKPLNNIPPSNFVFLIDVSGSMGSEDKLPLLKAGFKNFVSKMSNEDRVAIVTYAGNDKVVLESTGGNEKDKIKKAIDKLGAGGGTAGSKGIITAYEIAQKNFIKGGNNRIIIGTDGDFNVGITKTDDLVKLIEEKRESGVYLTALGVGRGNYNDAMMEKLSNKGNGTLEYIDNIKQLEKVFIYEKSKFYTVAKDVKVQVSFDPKLVKSYRLIGYENRVLNNKDFDDDKKDAGEIGANQDITAVYEIIPSTESDKNRAKSSLTIKFRYKKPNESESIALELGIKDNLTTFKESSKQMKFVSSVIGYSMLLIDSKYKNNLTYDDVLNWYDLSKMEDKYGFKQEFRNIVEKTKNMGKKQ